MYFTVSSLGEKAVIVRIEQQISEHAHQHVLSIEESIERAQIVGVKELVPAYCSIVVHYDPYIVWKYMNKERLDISPSSYMIQAIHNVIQKPQLHEQAKNEAARIVEIPVCYGEQYGPDLKEVARYNEMDITDVISLHSSQPYFVHMLGFAPGFPYLGGMDKRIAMPRKAIPRASIEAGSVGIAGEQTGIYPISTPGGWRIIGRTPLKLFRPEHHMPTLIKAGDYIKFIPITAQQFAEISAKQWT